MTAFTDPTHPDYNIKDPSLPLNYHRISISKRGYDMEQILVTKEDVVQVGSGVGAPMQRGAVELVPHRQDKGVLGEFEQQVILYSINEGNQYEGYDVEGEIIWKLLDVDRYKADVEN